MKMFKNILPLPSIAIKFLLQRIKITTVQNPIVLSEVKAAGGKGTVMQPTSTECI